MQLSAGPDFPHARGRVVPWLATAAALAAVLGLAAAVQPQDAQAGSSDAAPAGPDSSAARYPLECPGTSGQGVRVLDEGAADFDGDGRAETVALVRCASGNGAPPHGIFVLAHPAEPAEPPRVVETLLPASEGMTTEDFTVGERTAGTVRATLHGYSSPDVPRCCPDRQREVKWEWREGKFVLVPAPVAGSV
ncbi:hypothetical protein [Streptomyces oceani]|uniref:Secreted protein n=1 Tax=Streptomyces oceani TaxID=1075402 RepID=A0A1E7KHB4_9ACTN|nr:hypothetical protein [Streptomyces oceani]OEV03271.1 hypothetical protein AN216_12000 [Streptomyces oceani]